MTEKEKMLLGKIYDPMDKQLVEERTKADRLCVKYNNSSEDEVELRKEILDQLMPDRGEGTFLRGPIYFDYGTNLHVGKNFYANFNFLVLDVCPITIGDNVFFGPNVTLVPPLHPLRYQDRNAYIDETGKQTDKEYGKPITIGDNVWFGSNVTVVGGAKIGNGCVIGAGSVVTSTIPDNYLAYGVPCKPIRPITEEDSIYLKEELF